MPEIVKPQQRVRELTSVRRRIPIEVDGSVAYEIVMTIWSTFNKKGQIASFDLGEDWFEQVDSAIAEDLRQEIAFLGGPGALVWLGVLGLISAAPHPHDPESVLKWLAELNPERLRRWLLGYIGDQAAHHHDGSAPSLSLIEGAARGDREAVRQIVEAAFEPDAAEKLIAVFDTDPEEMRDRMSAALGRFRHEVFAQHEEEFATAIAAAAASRRSMAPRESAKEVIEDVTNGLDYEIPLGVTRVILVPTMVIRPLSLIEQYRDVLMVFYGLADEFISLNPEAPPSWLVRFFKALSDEKRLRILRRLSEADATLDELTELLDLSKSTVHHHITNLRGAGLIRVSLGSDKGESMAYGLRPQALEDATAFLDSYLRPDQKSQLA